jgi:hypothetical protein
MRLFTAVRVELTLEEALWITPPMGIRIAQAVLVLVAIAIGGCVTPTAVVSSSTKALLLTSAQTRQIRLFTVTFPAGVYTASFTTKEGTYYKASSALIHRAFGISSSVNGGVFIPFSTAADRRQAFWADERNTSGILEYLTTQPSNRYGFSPPLQVEYVDAASVYRNLPRTTAPDGQ